MEREPVNERYQLEQLAGSDFEIADGEPNIKGWDVKDSQNHTLGEVDELLFNPASRKVRYIVLDMEDNDLKISSRKVLIPLNVVQISEDTVILPVITVEQLEALPLYEKGKVSPLIESSVRSIFATGDIGNIHPKPGTPPYTGHTE